MTGRIKKNMAPSLILLVAAAALYWLSQPPMQFPWAAYLSAACWVGVVANNFRSVEQGPFVAQGLPTKKEYVFIWFTGFLMWLALLQGVRLASWPMYAGWVALSAYVACYLPIFVFTARSLHLTIKLPLSIACASSWVVSEWIRAHFATGFAAALLAHSQTPWPVILQIAAHFGSYGVSFFVVLTGAAIYESCMLIIRVISKRNDSKENGPQPSARPSYIKSSLAAHRQGPTIQSLGILCAVVLGIFGACAWSWNERESVLRLAPPLTPAARVLLIQGDRETNMALDNNTQKDAWLRYERQTALAAKNIGSSKVDLVVWPESTFYVDGPWVDWDKSPEVPESFVGSSEKFKEMIANLEASTAKKLHRIFSLFDQQKPQFVLGTLVTKIRSGNVSLYNSAVLARTENIADAVYYNKQHLVMFGEYIPIVSRFPLLLKRLGIGRYEPGTEPAMWQLPNGAKVSPSVCFENFLPHLIQSHVQRLTASGLSPEILINITNDGWFRGSSMLDHHLNSAILTAVENRRPMLVAGNQGISAWIDGSGRVIKSLAPLTSGAIVAEPVIDGRWGLWQLTGDLPELFLAMLCGLALLRDLVWRRAASGPHPSVRDCGQ
jgi:apolipoprotein N-acyltransferase